MPKIADRAPACAVTTQETLLQAGTLVYGSVPAIFAESQFNLFFASYDEVRDP